MKIFILLLLFVVSVKNQDLDYDAFSTPVIQKEESTKPDDPTEHFQGFSTSQNEQQESTEHSQGFSTSQNETQVSTSNNPEVIFQNQKEDIFLPRETSITEDIFSPRETSITEDANVKAAFNEFRKTQRKGKIIILFIFLFYYLSY